MWGGWFFLKFIIHISTYRKYPKFSNIEEDSIFNYFTRSNKQTCTFMGKISYIRIFIQINKTDRVHKKLYIFDNWSLGSRGPPSCTHTSSDYQNVSPFSLVQLMYIKVLGFVPIKMRCKVHSFVWCLQSFPLKLVHALATSLTWVQIHKIGLDITSKIYERQASIDRTTDVCFLLMSMQYELYISVILFIEWVDETRNSFCWFWACWVKCPSIYLLTNTPRIRWYIMNVICKDNHSKT